MQIKICLLSCSMAPIGHKKLSTYKYKVYKYPKLLHDILMCVIHPHIDRYLKVDTFKSRFRNSYLTFG